MKFLGDLGFLGRKFFVFLEKIWWNFVLWGGNFGGLCHFELSLESEKSKEFKICLKFKAKNPYFKM